MAVTIPVLVLFRILFPLHTIVQSLIDIAKDLRATADSAIGETRSSTASVISHLGEIEKSQQDLRRDIAKVASEVLSFNVLLTSLRGTGDAIAAAQSGLSALPPVGGSGIAAMPPLTFTSKGEAPSDDESEVCSDDESEGWPPSSQSMM